MAQLTIHVNGKPYTVGCEDGEEAHVTALAAQVDAKVREIGVGDPNLGDTRLMLMAALMLADDLTTVKALQSELETRVASLDDLLARVDTRAIAALEAAAAKIEAMAVR